MKYTIEGFSQERALELTKTIEVNGKEKILKIDFTDLVILRWLVDFYPNMNRCSIDGEDYVWLSHSKLVEDLPMADIKRKAFIERLKKLVILGVLDYKLVKQNGTYSFYKLGKEYPSLVSKSNGYAVQTAEGIRSNGQGVAVQTDTGSRSNGYGVAVQTDNKDISIKDISIKDSFTSIDKKNILSHSNAITLDNTPFEEYERITVSVLEGKYHEDKDVYDIRLQAYTHLTEHNFCLAVRHLMKNYRALVINEEDDTLLDKLHKELEIDGTKLPGSIIKAARANLVNEKGE